MRYSSTLVLLLLSFLPAKALTAQIEMDTPPRPPNPLIHVQEQIALQKREQIVLQEQGRLFEAARNQMAQIIRERACPVQLTVNRRPQGAVVETSSRRSQRRPPMFKIAIDDAVNAPDATKAIVEADVTLHGYSADTHTLLVGGAANHEITEFVHLKSGTAPGSINMWILTNEIATLNRIELTRIQYADGSVWQPSQTSTCFASPSPLLLVDASAR